MSIYFIHYPGFKEVDMFFLLSSWLGVYVIVIVVQHEEMITITAYEKSRNPIRTNGLTGATLSKSQPPAKEKSKMPI